MNFRRKMVYTAISCTLILVAALYTVISIVGFNSQNASAAPTSRAGMNEVGIKIKINYGAKTVLEPKKHEEATKEEIKNKLEKAIKDKTNLRVVTSGEEKPCPEWMIYYLINQEKTSRKRGILVPANIDPKVLKELINQQEKGATGMSITLTHDDRFIMNHIKTIHIDDPDDLGPFMDGMIEVVLNVIQQKIKNKNASIIVTTDKSTITAY